MRPSTRPPPTRCGLAAATIALSLGLAPCAPAPAAADDGALRIRESALNDFAASVQPLRLSQRYRFTLWVPNPFFFFIPSPVPFDCIFTASVTGIAFDVTPGQVMVRGTASGSVCGFGYQSPLSSSVAIALGSGGQSLVIVPGPLLVTPMVNILGFNVSAPSFNVAPSLTVPAIPLDSSPFEIETSAGPRTLRLAGRNLRLSRGDGYIEIRGDALLH